MVPFNISVFEYIQYNMYITNVCRKAFQLSTQPWIFRNRAQTDRTVAFKNLPGARERGEPIRMTGEKAWYSVYSVVREDIDGRFKGSNYLLYILEERYVGELKISV